MEENFIKINEWLLPLSWFYGLVVKVRNKLFDLGLLKSKAYDVPVISIGNITVGGTGKTPHVEYLIRLLKDKANVAVLSRGYKRKSKGFVLADKETPMQDIGDEPHQMKRKFPDVAIAVDKNRREGIEKLMDNSVVKDTEVILLDDAYQHRYVTPGINILLMDYKRPIIYDKMLPAGRLRESKEETSRADIVIVTKCPKDIRPMDYRVITKTMSLYPYQKLYFSTLEYGHLFPVFGNGASQELKSIEGKNILLLTGIASPQQMMLDLQPYNAQLTPLTFADHHNFTPKDIRDINLAFDQLPKPRLIITTEKDASRLETADGLSEDVKRNMYKLPVTIKFMLDQEESFNKNILEYVRKNSRNSILATKKDDNKAEDSHHPGNRPRKISFRTF